MKIEGLSWYPMRVTYNRELKVKASLDEMGIENFIPMCRKITRTDDGELVETLRPAIHNLIFIHSTISVLNEVKHKSCILSSLRYMVHRRKFVDEESRAILSVPDREMNAFMRVTSQGNERLIYLKYDDYVARPGRRVLVTGGPFAGVEGKIKRIQSNKKVVVELSGVLAVALTYIPANYLKIVSKEEQVLAERPDIKIG